MLAKTQPFYSGALKSTALRAPNAPQSYFASEQIVDELAHAMGIDPYTFRKKNIDGTATIGARWLAVLDGAVQASGYKPRVANSVAQTGTIRTGVGIGLGTFANSQCCHGGERPGEHEDRQDGRNAPDRRPEATGSQPTSTASGTR